MNTQEHTASEGFSATGAGCLTSCVTPFSCKIAGAAGSLADVPVAGVGVVTTAPEVFAALGAAATVPLACVIKEA